MEGNFGQKKLSDITESEQMRQWNDWIKSDDPCAVIQRKLREEQQQSYILQAQKEQLDYQKFINDNPEVVQRCREMAMQSIEDITKKLLWSEFERNKLKNFIKEKYSKL